MKHWLEEEKKTLYQVMLQAFMINSVFLKQIYRRNCPLPCPLSIEGGNTMTAKMTNHLYGIGLVAATCA